MLRTLSLNISFFVIIKAIECLGGICSLIDDCIEVNMLHRQIFVPINV